MGYSLERPRCSEWKTSPALSAAFEVKAAIARYDFSDRLGRVARAGFRPVLR